MLHIDCPNISKLTGTDLQRVLARGRGRASCGDTEYDPVHHSADPASLGLTDRRFPQAENMDCFS